MPSYVFECPAQNRMAGCVEKIVVRTPWWTGKVVNGQPVMDPRTGRQMSEPDARQTWAWLGNQGLPLPPAANFTAAVLAPTVDQNMQPMIICIQTTPPGVGHAPIYAPHGQPVAHTRQITPPPMVQPQGAPGQYRADPFEPLDNSALPGNADPMLGDVDPAGGTFTDIDSLGNEHQRVERVPFDPAKVQRG